MNQAVVEPTGEFLTLAEIEERYPDEWIFIEEPELDEDEEVARGRVVAHGKDRDAVTRIAIERRPKTGAFHYTGELPEFISLNL